MQFLFTHIFLLLASIPYGGVGVNAIPLSSLTVKIITSNPSPTLGDSLSIFCTITAPEDIQTKDPQLKTSSPFIELERRWKKDEESPAGIKKQTYCFSTYIIQPDTIVTGPFTVAFTTAKGDTGTVVSNSIHLVVKSAAAPSDSIPLPNRGPVTISSAWITWWIILVIVILFVIVTAIVIYILKKKKTDIKPSFTQPVNEIEEFEKIRVLNLYEKGKIRELYIQVSNAMRGFIHRKMNYDALYRTSEEITSHLYHSSTDRTVTASIQDILEESDIVKFSHYIPPEERSSTIIDRALIPIKIVIEHIERENARRLLEEKRNRERTISSPDLTVKKPEQ